MGRLIAILIAVLTAAPTAVAAEEALTACDQLAAHPFDPATEAPGVAFDAIDPVNAVMSCSVAFAEHPDVVRYKYQYGRALLAARRPSEALVFIRSAANGGYAAAQQSLATLMYDGDTLVADRIAAISLFHKAADQGHPVAQLRVAAFYLRGEGSPRDPAKAETFVRLAAARGLPAARTALELIAGSPPPTD